MGNLDRCCCLLRLETAVQGAHKAPTATPTMVQKIVASCAFTVPLFPWTLASNFKGASWYDTRKEFSNGKRPPWVKHCPLISPLIFFVHYQQILHGLSPPVDWSSTYEYGLRQVQALSLLGLPACLRSVRSGAPAQPRRAHQLAVSVQPPPTPAL